MFKRHTTPHIFQFCTTVKGKNTVCFTVTSSPCFTLSQARAQCLTWMAWGQAAWRGSRSPGAWQLPSDLLPSVRHGKQHLGAFCYMTRKSLGPFPFWPFKVLPKPCFFLLLALFCEHWWCCWTFRELAVLSPGVPAFPGLTWWFCISQSVRPVVKALVSPRAAVWLQSEPLVRLYQLLQPWLSGNNPSSWLSSGSCSHVL